MAAPGIEAIDRSAAMITDPVGLADWLIVAPVALPLLAAAGLMMIRKKPRWHVTVTVVTLLAMLLADGGLIWRTFHEGPLRMAMGSWLPPFGIVFAVDMLGALFATITAITGLICVFFARTEIDSSESRYGYFSFYLLMLAGVTGAFLTGDIFNLYVWFEVLLISSFGLLALGSHPVQLDGTFKYALLNLVATTLFLISVGLLYGLSGTLNMADLALKARQGELVGPVMSFGILMIVAFLMKAAAFPLNAWLPASYHVTRSSSAALFAALLTKVGIYALLRTMFLVFPDFGQTFSPLILSVANATMIVGTVGMLASADMRRLVGWAVISGIGVILAGMGMGGTEALGGAIAYAMHSMIVMGGLYLLVGALCLVAGKNDLASMGGLARSPLLTALGLALVLATAGLPPFSGLWPKAVLVEAALAQTAYLTAFVILLNGLFTTIALGRMFLFAFWRPEADGTGDVRLAERPGFVHGRIWPIAAFAAISLAAGLYPEPWLAGAQMAASGLTDATAYIATVLPEGRP